MYLRAYISAEYLDACVHAYLICSKMILFYEEGQWGGTWAHKTNNGEEGGWSTWWPGYLCSRDEDTSYTMIESEVQVRGD